MSFERDPSQLLNQLPLGSVVGDFRITGVLGEGGFGIVYAAHDDALDRTVAIKEYLPSMIAGRTANQTVAVRSPSNTAAFEAGLKNFIREARMLARFSHPALVEIYRVWEQNGTAYMAMRYIAGRTLREVGQSTTIAFDEATLRQALLPVFDALELLHAQNVIHRDVSPDNIMLREDGYPVLLDLGSARLVVGGMTQALTTVLKPGYAPIEQYVDDGTMSQGPWTDVYGLGATLYYLLVGSAPPQSIARMISDPLRSISDKARVPVPERIYAATLKALAVRPEHRFQTVADFREALGWNDPLAQPASISRLCIDPPARPAKLPVTGPPPREATQTRPSFASTPSGAPRTTRADLAEAPLSGSITQAPEPSTATDPRLRDAAEQPSERTLLVALPPSEQPTSAAIPGASVSRPTEPVMPATPPSPAPTPSSESTPTGSHPRTEAMPSVEPTRAVTTAPSTSAAASSEQAKAPRRLADVAIQIEPTQPRARVPLPLLGGALALALGGAAWYLLRNGAAPSPPDSPLGMRPAAPAPAAVPLPPPTIPHSLAKVAPDPPSGPAKTASPSSPAVRPSESSEKKSAERTARATESKAWPEAEERGRARREEASRKPPAEAQPRREAEAPPRQEAEAQARRDAEERAAREREEAARLAAEREAAARAQQEARQRQEAERAARRDSDSSGGLSVNLAAAQRGAEAPAVTSGRKSVNELSSEGASAYRRGDLSTARAAWNEIVRHPEATARSRATAHNNLAISYCQTGDLASCERHYAAMLRADPSYLSEVTERDMPPFNRAFERALRSVGR
ncbi:MAG: protein kinase [Casimicrobiaceae bacterium]|nr:protein kinase [Casimicrobiaceae bacterium]